MGLERIGRPNYLFGIDVGGTVTKVGLFTTNGRMVAHCNFVSIADGGVPQVREVLVENLDALLEGSGLARADVLGVGLGVPAMIDSRGKVNAIVNIDLDMDAISEQLAREFPSASRIVVNDANGAAFGEMWQGSARGMDDVVFITLGTGVGAGVIAGGRLVVGANGVAGEIGHLEFVHDGLPCNCGRRGCLERYVSASAVAAAAKRALGEGAKSSLENVRDLDAKAVFDASLAGDGLARSVVSTFAEQLGTALAMVACVVNPQVFVLGGGASLSGDAWLAQVQDSYRRHALAACAGTPVLLALLGNDAGMYGDAYLAMQAARDRERADSIKSGGVSD